MTTEERYLDDTFVLSSISRELVEAATRKDLRGLQQLLEQHSNYLKSNINSPIIIRTEDSGRSYLSLLQYVLFCFSMEDEQENERSSPIIQMLIDSGADLNADFVFTATFPTGTELCTHETFLSILAQAGKLALVKLLLKNKARVVRQSETFFGLESLATAFLLAASGVQSTVTEISALTCAGHREPARNRKTFLERRGYAT